MSFPLSAARSPILLCLMLLLLFGMMGCGDSKSTFLAVKGTATHAGEPLPGATVYFTRVDGGAVSWGLTDEAGRFSLQHSKGHAGAEPGQYKVSIAFRPQTVEEEMQLTQGTFPPTVKYADILKKFATAKASTIEVEVAEGQKSFDLKFD